MFGFSKYRACRSILHLGKLPYSAKRKSYNKTSLVISQLQKNSSAPLQFTAMATRSNKVVGS